MHHVHENLVYFAAYCVFAAIALPVLELIPPQGVQRAGEWILLPFTLMPCIAIFGNRVSGIESAYRYIVFVGVIAILLWFISRIVGWLFITLAS